VTDDAPKPDLKNDFRDDLDSLFVLVDSRMAERRGTVASSTQEQFVGRAAAIDTDQTLAIRAAVREAVDDLFREKLAVQVRAAVEDALRQAPVARAAIDEEPRLRRRTMVSIRLRRAFSW
jgi:hypothetical protein